MSSNGQFKALDDSSSSKRSISIKDDSTDKTDSSRSEAEPTPTPSSRPHDLTKAKAASEGSRYL